MTSASFCLHLCTVSPHTESGLVCVKVTVYAFPDQGIMGVAPAMLPLWLPAPRKASNHVSKILNSPVESSPPVPRAEGLTTASTDLPALRASNFGCLIPQPQSSLQMTAVPANFGLSHHLSNTNQNQLADHWLILVPQKFCQKPLSLGIICYASRTNTFVFLEFSYPVLPETGLQILKQEEITMIHQS